MQEETRQVLSTFIEKAEKLNRLKMRAQMEGGYVKILISQDEQHIMIEKQGPEEDSIDAFALTFRLFTQKNEPISIGSLEKSLRDPAISDSTRNEFQCIRGEINTYFDSNDDVNINIFGFEPTMRDIYETFLYGHLAHTNNEEKRERFMQWKAIPTIYPILEQFFTDILNDVFEAINYLSHVFQKELDGTA